MDIDEVRREIMNLDDTVFSVLRDDFKTNREGSVALDTKKVNLGNMEGVIEASIEVRKALNKLNANLNS